MGIMESANVSAKELAETSRGNFHTALLYIFFLVATSSLRTCFDTITWQNFVLLISFFFLIPDQQTFAASSFSSSSSHCFSHRPVNKIACQSYLTETKKPSRGT